MGAPVAGTAFRRASAIVIGLATTFAFVVGAAAPAHAVHFCDSSSLPCITAVPDTYTTTFNTKLTVPAATGVTVNDSGGLGTAVDVLSSDNTSFNGAAVDLN